MTQKPPANLTVRPLSTTDLELIHDFTRIVETDEGTTLEVGVVTWDSQEPNLDWKPFLQWSHNPTEQELLRAKKKALHTRKFFKMCQTCKQRCNVGHMFHARMCQTCASRDFGVVF